ncbi:hypothetical protein [Thalassobacillus pellis]|uniref:hypothetical protein n=1 Tax=Thalassobacillus pellis TaxID=748008 RepID=UPI00195F35F5|nr:hypothetical protein [Thalassobacillus pellis]MBM7552457.1 hypothetical protein [Thalassobacillus pellis]
MRVIHIVMAPLVLMLLTGCLYPESRLSKNQISNQAQLENVQEAVSKYKEQEQGLIPIQTKPQDTPIFQKYLVDFQKLKENNLISDIPGNAFQNGGVYQYVIVYPEDNPTVKLIDLRLADQLRSLQFKIQRYQAKNKYVPYGSKVAKGVFEIKYEQLGLEARPTVNSPYSDKLLPIYLNGKGELLIDYRKDLYDFLQKYEHNFQTGEDIRYILVNNSPFVPAYSPPYTIENGEPVFMSES